MQTLPQLPEIPPEDRTPLVKNLLAMIEQLLGHVHQQQEKVQHLKEEIRVLKGEQRKPRFKASRLEQETEKSRKKGIEGKVDKKRPGSNKRFKTAELTIHEDKVIPPVEPIPVGSRFKGYQDFVVQDFVIKPHNTLPFSPLGNPWRSSSDRPAPLVSWRVGITAPN